MSPVTAETELAADDYARLQELADAEGRSIEEALREAVVEWLDRHGVDRLFTFHDGYEVPTAGRTNAESIERMLYGQEDRS